MIVRPAPAPRRGSSRYLRYFRPFDNNATAEFSASAAPTSNACTIDGAINQAHRQGNADSRMAFTPPASAVQEFKVETVTFDAQHGRAGGATVNVAMKSGTNAFTGEAYEYYRDEGLAENDFFPGRRGQPEPTLDDNADRTNLQPRLGAAYRLDDKTVLRGGWAIDTVPAVVHGVLLLASSQSTPLVITLDQGRPFATSLTTPFPNGALDPPGKSAGVNTNVGQGIGRLYNDVNFRNGQAMRWVATYRREFVPRWIAEASYVGTYAYDLRTDIALNPIPPRHLSRSALRDDATNGNLTATCRTRSGTWCRAPT